MQLCLYSACRSWALLIYWWQFRSILYVFSQRFEDIQKCYICRLCDRDDSYRSSHIWLGAVIVSSHQFPSNITYGCPCMRGNGCVLFHLLFNVHNWPSKAAFLTQAVYAYRIQIITKRKHLSWFIATVYQFGECFFNKLIIHIGYRFTIHCHYSIESFRSRHFWYPYHRA